MVIVSVTGVHSARSPRLVATPEHCICLHDMGVMHTPDLLVNIDDILSVGGSIFDEKDSGLIPGRTTGLHENEDSIQQLSDESLARACLYADRLRNV